MEEQNEKKDSSSGRRGFVRKIMKAAAASALAGLLLGRSTQPALGATNTFPADGNVGIGTLSPVRQLHIQGNNAVARLDRDTDSASVIFARTAPENFSQVWKSFTLGVKASGVDNGSFFIGDMHTNVSGSSDNRLLIDRAGRLGIGTTAPSWPVDIVGDIEGWNQPIISITNLGNDTARYLAKACMDNPGGFFAFSSSGPSNAPTATRSGTNLLIVSACGYDGFEYTPPMAEIGLSAAEDYTPSGAGAQMIFSTAQKGTRIPIIRMLIDHDGKIGFGTQTPASKLHVTSDSSTSGETGVTVDIPGVGARRIVVGAPDSAGSGYRTLKVAN